MCILTRKEDIMPSSLRLVLTSILAVAALSSAALANATTLNVCSSGCLYSRIQDAIVAAQHGDVIQIGAGTYFENLKVNKSLTLNGAGRDKTRIDGRLLAPVVTLDGGSVTGDVPVILSNMTITHGRGIGVGGGVDVEGGMRLQMSYCIVISNRSDSGSLYSGFGGGVALASFPSKPNSIANSLIVYNHSSGDAGGVGVSYESSVQITASSITRNDAVTRGGGISVLNKAVASITGSSLTDNQAKAGGGGIATSPHQTLNPSGSITLLDSVIANNSTAGDGGGMNGPLLTATDTIFTRNQASGEGGGLALPGGLPALVHVFVIQNFAHQAGGILTAGALTLSHTTIAENSPNNCVETTPAGSGCP
jgi:hypothetical protein